MQFVSISQISTVKRFLVNCGVVAISPTSYSPDLEPADFLLFFKMETALKERQFQGLLGHQVIDNLQIKCSSLDTISVIFCSL